MIPPCAGENTTINSKLPATDFLTTDIPFVVMKANENGVGMEAQGKRVRRQKEEGEEAYENSVRAEARRKRGSKQKEGGKKAYKSRARAEVTR